MSQYDYKLEYERNLPHIQPPGAVLFVTFRLAGSIPKEILAQLKDEAEERERIIRQRPFLPNAINIFIRNKNVSLVAGIRF
ncbi:MAG: hypothetical protein GY943_22020 [Chloroflexi bacterium]|nr:hypothetical protein [Chloroflexota bacterium]